MTIKVFTIESERESATRLGFPTHTACCYAHAFDNDIVIRWGNSTWVYDKKGSRCIDFKNVINPAPAIKQNCKKNETTKLLAHVVNVPTLYEKSVPKGVLAVIRPLEHSAGNEFSVKEGPFKITPGTYGRRFLKTDAEYRVWFCGNKTMCGRRVKMKVNEDQKYPCRSGWGYEFCEGIALDLHHQTLMAAKKIGLDVGAADVLFYKKKWYFLELNSAASVDHRQIREFYQKALEELVKKKLQEQETAKKEAEEKAKEITPTAVVEVVPPTVQVIPVIEIRPNVENIITPIENLVPTELLIPV